MIMIDSNVLHKICSAYTSAYYTTCIPLALPFSLFLSIVMDQFKSFACNAIWHTRNHAIIASKKKRLSAIE